MCIVLSKYLQTGLYNYNLPYCVAIYSQTKASTLTFTRKVPKYIIHFWRYLSVKVCTGVFFSKGSLAGVLILGGGCIVSHHIGGFYLRVRGGGSERGNTVCCIILPRPTKLRFRTKLQLFYSVFTHY